jgi:hypothetical protein
MPEWPNGADSKSVGLCLRGFESSSPHLDSNPVVRAALQRSLLVPVALTLAAAPILLSSFRLLFLRNVFQISCKNCSSLEEARHFNCPFSSFCWICYCVSGFRINYGVEKFEGNFLVFFNSQLPVKRPGFFYGLLYPPLHSCC